MDIHFVTMHAFDRQTDEGKTDGQKSLRNHHRALHCMQSHGKNDDRNKYK